MADTYKLIFYYADQKKKKLLTRIEVNNQRTRMVLNHPTVYMNLPLPALNSRLTETQLSLILCFFIHFPLKFPISKAEKNLPTFTLMAIPEAKKLRQLVKSRAINLSEFLLPNQESVRKQVKRIRDELHRKISEGNFYFLFFFFFLVISVSIIN